MRIRERMHSGMLHSTVFGAPPCECVFMQLKGRMHPKSYAHVCVGRECKVVHPIHIRVHYVNVAFVRILFHSITMYTHAYVHVFAASCIHMHAVLRCIQ